MAQQPINHGSAAGDGQGENLFSAFTKVNANDAELFGAKTVFVANVAALPATGEVGKIYVTLDDDAMYRWTGTGYDDLGGIQFVANAAALPVAGEALKVYVALDTGVAWWWNGTAYQALGWNSALTGLVHPVTGKALATLGSNVITVGAGGTYQTLGAALAYISSRSGADVWTETIGAGTVAVTQGSDVVTGTGTAFLANIQPGDYVSIAGDGNGGFVVGTLQHTLWHVQSNTLLRIGTGFIGASGSGKAYSIWRPVKYTILLLAGVHELDANYILPQGMTLSIVGMGQGLTTLKLVGAGFVSFQRSNQIDLGSLTLYSRDSANDFLGSTNGLGGLDCGLGSFNIHDIHCDYEGIESTTVGPAMFHLKGSMIRISNITGRVASAFATTMSDYIEYNNLHLETYNVGADCIQNTGYAAFSSTKPWLYNNVGIDRKLAGITGGGAMFEMNGTVYVGTGFTNNKKVHLNDVQLIDRDQQGSASPSCMQISAAMANSSIYLNDVIIGGTRGINLNGDATVLVYGRNVTNLAGQPPNFINTVNPYYCLTKGTRSVAYAATVTPNANLGDTVVVGALTGNTTIAAPLYPVNGQELTLVFTQDATGSRTITWNAVFKKSADGAGAANTKGATTFKYDGVNWMQIGGALVWL